MNRTFVMCKPDAVARGLVGEVIRRIEAKGLTLVAVELRTIDRSLAEQHYAEHVGKPFYDDLLEFITSGPVVAMVVEGPEDNTWQLVRTLMGATKVEDAAPGSIRGDFATTTTSNLVHGADGPASAAREIGLYFPGL
jgi:nucleoside-diphosphate kinase